MVGSIIGAGVSVLGGIAGAIGQAGAAKKQQRMLKQASADNQSFYDKNFNADYTQRADTQALLENQRQALARQNRVSQNTGVITGATDEAMALQKAAANDVMAQTTSNINAQADTYKQGILSRYMDTKDKINGQMMQSYQQQGEAWGNVAKSASGAGSSIAGLFNQKK